MLRRLAGDGAAVCLATHDIGSLASVADQVSVIYRGRIVETGPAETVLSRALHPYTNALVACIPRFDSRAKLVPIPGDPPGDSAVISGCYFHPRCGRCEKECRSLAPSLRTIEPGRSVACHMVTDGN